MHIQTTQIEVEGYKKPKQTNNKQWDQSSNLKNLPTKKTLEPHRFIAELYEIIKERKNTNASQIISWNRKGKNTFELTA